jgi:hypothetical protein
MYVRGTMNAIRYIVEQAAGRDEQRQEHACEQGSRVQSPPISEARQGHAESHQARMQPHQDSPIEVYERGAPAQADQNDDDARAD